MSIKSIAQKISAAKNFGGRCLAPPAGEYHGKLGNQISLARRDHRRAGLAVLFFVQRNEPDFTGLSVRIACIAQAGGFHIGPRPFRAIAGERAGIGAIGLAGRRRCAGLDLRRQPAPQEGARYAFEEFSLRRGDFALCMAAAVAGPNGLRVAVGSVIGCSSPTPNST